jgi:hypothetical protein
MRYTDYSSFHWNDFNYFLLQLYFLLVNTLAYDFFFYESYFCFALGIHSSYFRKTSLIFHHQKSTSCWNHLCSYLPSYFSCLLCSIKIITLVLITLNLYYSLYFPFYHCFRNFSWTPYLGL